MRRTAEEIVEQIRSLRGTGLSFREIKQRLPNTSLGVIHKYAKNISLTEKQQERLLRKEREGQMKLVSRTIKPIKKQMGMTLSKTRIIAHLLFDGCLDKTKHRIIFTCSSPQVIQQFIEDVELVYGLTTFSTVDENDKGCQSIIFSSILMERDLSHFASTYSCKANDIRIPQFIKDGHIDFKQEFLRCFWSDEGGLGIIEFLWEIAHIHNEFGIRYRVNERISKYKSI